MKAKTPVKKSKHTGRIPRPIKELALEQGKLYGALAIRQEIEPTSELVPSPPPEFTPTEMQAWEFYKQILEEYGLFKFVNAPLIKQAAIVDHEVYRIQDEIRTLLMFGTNSSEQRTQYEHLVTQRQKGFKELREIYKMLGLSSEGIAKMSSLIASSRESQERQRKKNDFFEE